MARCSGRAIGRMRRSTRRPFSRELGLPSRPERPLVASIAFKGVGKVYPDGTRAVVDLNLAVEDGGSWFSSGRRAAARRPRFAWSPGSRTSPRDDLDRRQGRQRPRAAPTRHRDGLPELRALSAHVGVREHRLPAQMAGGAKARDASSGSSAAAELLGITEHLSASRAALRRPAPAGRDGPCDRPRAAGLPDGRAAVEPRRQAPRPDAGGDRRGCSASSA